MSKNKLVVFSLILTVLWGSVIYLNFIKNNVLGDGDFQDRSLIKRVIHIQGSDKTVTVVEIQSRSCRVVNVPGSFRVSKGILLRYPYRLVPAGERNMLIERALDTDVNLNLRDPTYIEALKFIALDPTDKNEYYGENYTCGDFAADFKENALKAGYRCGYVIIEFPDYLFHTIVCFNTTDQGIIFVEPQTDEIVTLTVGEPYWERTRYGQPSYNDTIVGYVIIW